MKFNEKLIALRKEKGWSQEVLAEKLEVARQTISKWELGETTPEMDKLIQLSNLFSITLDELVKDTNTVTTIQNNTNTQKLAGIIIKILKVCGILLIAYLIISFVSIILFTTFKKETHRVTEHYQEIISNSYDE